VKKFENPLGFDKVTPSVGWSTFLRHSVYHFRNNLHSQSLDWCKTQIRLQLIYNAKWQLQQTVYTQTKLHCVSKNSSHL